MDKENKENQFGKIISELKGIKKPLLTDIEKLKLKNKVFSKLTKRESNYDSLISSLSKFASIFKIDLVTKARIKENVFAMIENHSQKKFFISNFLRFSKSYVSLVVLISMFFSTASFLNLDTSVARAESFSTIESVEGIVVVQRNGLLFPVYRGFKIKENDKILTSPQGTVVVKYFDDSVNRLASNTVVEINKLDEASDTKLGTHVEVAVLDGVVWSKVMNLNDIDSTFVLDFDGLQVEADGSAAFNVELENGQAELEVFTSTIEVESSTKKEKIVKGEKLMLDVENSELGKKRKIGNSAKNDSWVEDNLVSDEIYTAKIQEDLLVAQIELVGVEVEDDLNFDNTFREETLLFLTFDDVKKQKIKLELAEKNFIEAQIKLSDEGLNLEEKEKIEVILSDFEKEFKEFYMFVEDIKAKDSKYAIELKSYLDGKIINYKKDFSLFTPDSPQYKSKEIIENLEVLTAGSKEEVVEIKIEQAEQKIDLIAVIVEEDIEVVTEIVNEYTEEITDAIEMVDYIEDDSVVKEEIVEGLKADLDLLESIEAEADVDLESGEVKSEIIDAVDEVGLDSDLIEDKVYIPVPIISLEEEVLKTEELKNLPYNVNVRGDKILPPLLNR